MAAYQESKSRVAGTAENVIQALENKEEVLDDNSPFVSLDRLIVIISKFIFTSIFMF